jgi:hypothetical protein
MNRKTAATVTPAEIAYANATLRADVLRSEGMRLEAEGADPKTVAMMRNRWAEAKGEADRLFNELTAADKAPLGTDLDELAAREAELAGRIAEAQAAAVVHRLATGSRVAEWEGRLARITRVPSLADDTDHRITWVDADYNRKISRFKTEAGALRAAIRITQQGGEVVDFI